MEVAKNPSPDDAHKAQLEQTDRDTGLLAVARGFSASIFWACGAGVLIAAVLGLFTDTTNLVVTATVVALVGALQWVRSGQWVRVTSVAMLAVLFAGVFYSMYRFGSVSIAQASMAGIPIIFCVIVLGERAGAALLVVSIFASAWITWLQITGGFTSVSPTLPKIQWVILLVGFVVAYRLGVLFKRNLLDSALRTNAYQRQLLQERERSSSEIGVALGALARQKLVIDQHAIVVVTDTLGCIRYTNLKFEEVSGYAQVEVQGRPLVGLLAGLRDAKEFALRFDDPQDGKVWRDELCMNAKNGRMVWLDTTMASLTTSSGAPREFILVCSDITQLREAKELAQATNLAKSQFFAAASHDLRQPVHALGMFVARLSQLPVTAHTQELVKGVESSVHVLQNMLDSLFDLTRIQAGDLQIELQPVSVQRMFNQLNDSLSSVAAEKGLRLRFRRTKSWVMSDPVLLHRILLNLVSNALRYTETGTVLVSCRRGNNGQARLEVWDSGVGIAAEDHTKIFQEFYQVKNPERDRAKGLGVGLSIVQRACDLLGHQVRLRSAPGCGSRFSIDVPLTATDTAETTEGKGEEPPVFDEAGLEGLRVLVVEDDPLGRLSLTGLLESWGCQTLVADGPAAAHGLLLQGLVPQIICCDLRLEGGTNGVDLIQHLRLIAQSDIPAFVISGDTDDAARSLAKAASLILLQKPVRPAKLRTIVWRLARQ